MSREILKLKIHKQKLPVKKKSQLILETQKKIRINLKFKICKKTNYVI